MSEEHKNTISKLLVVTASTFIIIAGLKAASTFIIPILLSALIAILCTPPMFWLQRLGVPKAIAIIIITISFLISGSLLFSFFGSSIAEFTSALPGYQKRFNAEYAAVVLKSERYGIDASNLLQIDTSSVVTFIKRALASLGGILSNTLLIVLTVIFMLFEVAGFPSKMEVAFGIREKHSINHTDKILKGIKRYLALKFMTSLATGFLITCWALLLGIDFPYLMGLLAFMLNFVPTIGSIIAAIPAVLLAFIDSGLSMFFISGIGYVVINVFISNGIEPRIMGQGVGLSTLVVFVSLVFWGWILGPVGMLLSVPLTMTLKIWLESKESTRWIAVLLGPEIHHKKVDTEE